MSYGEEQSLHEEHERRRDRKRARSCDPILTGTNVPDCCVRSRSPRPFTCVFWDLEDCSIPKDLENDSVSIYQNIKSNLANNGYRGNMSIMAYAEKNKLSEKLMSDLSDAGISFSPEVPRGKDARVNRMLYDILLWASDNPVDNGGPKRANLIVISNNIGEETEFFETLCILKSRGYFVLLVHPESDDKGSSRKLPTASTEWLLTSQSDGGKPIDQSGSSKAIDESNKKSEDEQTMAQSTRVFWDVEDCPVPEEIFKNPYLISDNISSALLNEYDYHEYQTIWCYVKDKWSDKWLYLYRAAGIGIFNVPGDKDARVHRMLVDILFGTMLRPTNVMVISRNLTEATIYVLNALMSRGINVFLVHPGHKAISSGVLSHAARFEWCFKCLLCGAKPLDQSGVVDNTFCPNWEARQWKKRNCECSERPRSRERDERDKIHTRRSRSTRERRSSRYEDRERRRRRSRSVERRSSRYEDRERRKRRSRSKIMSPRRERRRRE